MGNITTIRISNPFAHYYELSDAERFPAAHETSEGRPETLFWADFKVAEAFGMRAVRDTFANCGDLNTRDWKETVELVAVLNHLGWEAHQAGHLRLSDYYFAKYRTVDAVAKERIGEDSARAQYYFAVMD